MKTILLLLITLISCNKSNYYIHQEVYQNEICITLDLYKTTTNVCGKNCEKCPAQKYAIPNTYRIVTVFKQTHLVEKCRCEGSVYVYQKEN